MNGIIRVEHKQKFSVISNDLLNDENLSWEARGVMGYLLSKPDGWVLRTEDLVKRGPAGIAKVKRIIKELKVNGYIHRKRENNENGYLEWVTIVYESKEENPKYKEQPKVEKRTIGSPMVEKPTVGSPNDGLPNDGKPTHIVSTESVSTESVSTEGSKAPTKKLSPIPSALCDICIIDPDTLLKPHLRELQDVVQSMEAKQASLNDIQGFPDWWYPEHWKGKKGEPPELKDICKEWGRYQHWLNNGKKAGARRNGHGTAQHTPTAADPVERDMSFYENIAGGT